MTFQKIYKSEVGKKDNGVIVKANGAEPRHL